MRRRGRSRRSCGSSATRSSSASTRSAAARGPGRSRSAPRCCHATAGSTASATRRCSPRATASGCSTASPRWCATWGVGHATQVECDELGMAAAQRLACQPGDRPAVGRPRRGDRRRQLGLRLAVRRPRRAGDQGRRPLPRRRRRQHPRQGQPRPGDARRTPSTTRPGRSTRTRATPARPTSPPCRRGGRRRSTAARGCSWTTTCRGPGIQRYHRPQPDAPPSLFDDVADDAVVSRRRSRGRRRGRRRGRSADSMPTDSRRRLSGTSSGEPAAEAWVIAAGCSIRLSTAPSDSASVNTRGRRGDPLGGLGAAAHGEADHPAEVATSASPRRRGRDGRGAAGRAPARRPGGGRSRSTTARALLQWRSMRTASVLTPRSTR